MKNRIVSNLPRYMLLLGILAIGLMYLFPLGDLNPSVYAKHTTQADMAEGFMFAFKEITFLVVLGFIIFIILRKFKFTSMIAILLYGILAISKVGIPFQGYFGAKYGEGITDYNLIVHFVMSEQVAGWGDDTLSARRCEVGQEMCVIIFWAMVVLLAVTTVILIISLFMFVKENSWSDVKEMAKKKKIDFKEKIHGIFT